MIMPWVISSILFIGFLAMSRMANSYYQLAKKMGSNIKSLNKAANDSAVLMDIAAETIERLANRCRVLEANAEHNKNEA